MSILDILTLVLQVICLIIANSAEASGYHTLSNTMNIGVAFFGLSIAASAGMKDEKVDKLEKWPYLFTNLLYIAGIVVTLFGVPSSWWLSIIALIQGMTLVHFWNHVSMDDY